MPFTGSHPAAVLPMLRRLPPSALVIGSLVPDIPLYVRTPVGYHATHTLAGVVTVDLVLGLAVLVLWHELIGPAVVKLAPPGLGRRLTRPAPSHLAHQLAHPARFALTVAGLVVGALTHVIWDEFTHAGRWGTAHIAWLAAWHGRQPGWAWAQDASTLAGAAALLAYGLWWWRRHAPSGAPVAAPAGLRWAAYAAIGLATLVGAGYGWRLVPSGGGTRHSAAFLAATHGVNAGLAILAVAVVAVTIGAPQWTDLRARS